jgi:hypothetical protein
MRISAEIKTGDRRVIEYILSPVMLAVKEAGREMSVDLIKRARSKSALASTMTIHIWEQGLCLD